jgi:hypothetical protein
MYAQKNILFRQHVSTILSQIQRLYQRKNYTLIINVSINFIIRMVHVGRPLFTVDSNY